MNKFGVQYDNDLTKTAAQHGLCPGCGTGLSKEEQAARHCPYCGTEPWEKKPVSDPAATKSR